MKNIGLLVAVEISSVTKRYGAPANEGFCGGFPLMTYRLGSANLHVLHTGAGEIAAAAGTQALISQLKCEMIVNFGVVGGLTPEMSLAKICVVEKAVHYDFDGGSYTGLPVGQYETEPSMFVEATTELVARALEICPELKPVTCASADKFVESPERKAELSKTYGAQICEMEAAGIIYTCRRNKIPCLLIKAVSDSIQGGYAEFLAEIDRVSDICLSVTEEIIKGVL